MASQNTLRVMPRGGGKPTRVGSTRLGFHQGRTLLHLASVYPRLLLVILELVQNALDECATKIEIKINYKTRDLAVRDNGLGTSVDKFNRALATVATPGRKSKDKLGQFGIGLISALGKCLRFLFTSSPNQWGEGFHQWTLDTEAIASQPDSLEIPVISRPDLVCLPEDQAAPSGRQKVWWRAEARLVGFTTDEFISRIKVDELVGGIRARYNTVMRKHRTVISIAVVDERGHTTKHPDVGAMDFTGRPLGDWIYRGDSVGSVLARLFEAPRGAKGRSGKVVVGVMGNDFRFPFHYFSPAAKSIVGEDVLAALNSGLLEGEILGQKLELRPDRNSFVPNDAFVDFCAALEEWFKAQGSSYLDEIKGASREARFQALGLRSMKVLEALLKDPKNESLLRVLDGFRQGTVSPKVDLAGAKVTGEQKQPALSLVDTSTDSGPHLSDVSRPKPQPSKPDGDRPHTPLTVRGPRGKPRKTVKSTHLGLQFCYEPMEGSPALWDLDGSSGILTFNIRHPHWMACESRDSYLMRLQETVAMQALTLMVLPETSRLVLRQGFDALMDSEVWMILEGDKNRKLSAKGDNSPD